jgi:hypothetical protein
MREINFRFWNRKELTMEQWPHIFINSFWNIFVNKKDWLEWEDCIESWIYYIPMQSTWMKDKNWNEVYEWDVIISHFEWREYLRREVIIDECEKMWYLYVIYNHEWWYYEVNDWVKDKNKHHALLEEYSCWWCEIIWNIYENPELYKQ